MDDVPNPDDASEDRLSNILTDTADEEYVPEIPEYQSEDDDEDQETWEEKPKKRTTKQPVRRQKWTSEEVKEIQELFKKEFESDKCPSQKCVENAIKISQSNAGHIYKRNRDTIKKKVSNMMVKRRNCTFLN